MGIFGDLFSSKPAEEAAKKKIAGINAGLDSAYGFLDRGKSEADALYSKAYTPFETLYNKLGKGVDTYLDASGANGSEGAARAAALYRSMPGYNAGREMGINDLERRAAARGDLGGGNLSADTIKFASDYDAGKYKDFLSSLSPTLAGATTAAAGGSSVLGANAAADLGVAGQKANYGYTGNAAIGGANADAEMAKYGASQNFWNTLLGGANLALKASGVGGFGVK